MSAGTASGAEQSRSRPSILGYLVGVASHALRRWCVATAEEASEAAMGRLRHSVVVITLSVAMAVGATIAYVTFLNELILAFRELDAHPLLRALVPLVLLILPLLWLWRRASGLTRSGAQTKASRPP